MSDFVEEIVETTKRIIVLASRLEAENERLRMERDTLLNFLKSNEEK